MSIPDLFFSYKILVANAIPSHLEQTIDTPTCQTPVCNSPIICDGGSKGTRDSGVSDGDGRGETHRMLVDVTREHDVVRGVVAVRGVQDMVQVVVKNVDAGVRSLLDGDCLNQGLEKTQDDGDG